MNYSLKASEKASLRAISLGAGVQSSTLLLMADKGEVGPKPDLLLEPLKVPIYFRRLPSSIGEYGNCSIPIETVMAGNIRSESLDNVDGGFVTLPFFTTAKGGRGRMQRQCTKDYKIMPIRRLLSKLYRQREGMKERARIPEGGVSLWIGISWDEMMRMKAPVGIKWLSHRWPLIERRMTRTDCLFWMRENGFPEPPKSSCVGCPFHDDNAWAAMKREQPDQFADAVEFDKQIRHVGKLKANAFLHRSCKPLDQVEFREKLDDGQLMLGECEGFCGL